MNKFIQYIFIGYEAEFLSSSPLEGPQLLHLRIKQLLERLLSQLVSINVCEWRKTSQSFPILKVAAMTFMAVFSRNKCDSQKVCAVIGWLLQLTVLHSNLLCSS